ncbi:hypothetical protein L202_07104 [Cryptococcus amylolentus CBS 6039]|uniref:Uncharacterized protein n=1 Tax=Cryptococcus amylolentus CBS 6039 TaxID=1295533 RepID=A0A1E3HF84_9TREE|nr:hypothetical protein L202_07104 [Cryptococcus amylolentus CBS 6039]ODN74785.1 hypothetical protein L202_07104 [Cryptococcus amylolentus CBS 6039]
MGLCWTDCYRKIPDEPEFQADHVVLYLREFCVPPKAVYPTKWRTNVDFSQTSFYVSLEKEFTDLEIVQSVRDHDPEVKAASMMSTELGATKSDVCLTGYHIENSRKRRIEKSPRAAEIWEIPIAPSKPSTLSSSSSGFLGQEKVSSIYGTSTYTSKTSTTQTWRPSLRQSYSLLGYDLSKCRSAMASVNGNYTRILNLTHLVPEGEEVVWEGVTLKGDSGRSILVEADPNVVAELRRRDLHCVSPEQFGVLAGGDPLFGMQWKAPNSLIAKYEDWSLDLKAKDRLDATVYMNLALATHHPETAPDPPINKRSLKNVIDADTSDEVASPSKRQKRADGSGPTEYFLPSPPKSMIATPPPSPSSFSTISSCFEIEHPVNVEEWCLSVKQEASTDQSFVDTAIHHKPVTYTTAEKVFPREYWAHRDYINHFSRLSVTFVLATPTEVDVLLARAAKFGWGGAQGRG